jgi:tetratricopeptide (TPR) repeat protein
MKTGLLISLFLMSSIISNAQYSTTSGSGDFGYGDHFVDNRASSGSMVSELMNPFTFYEKGKSLERNDDYNGALAEFDKATTLDEGFAEAYDYKAIVYIKLGRFQKALKEVSKALENDPDLAEAYNHWGIILFYQENFTQAINEYTRAITLKPAYGNAYFNRALARLSANDLKGSYDDLIRARNLKCEGIDEVIHEYFPEKEK